MISVVSNWPKINLGPSSRMIFGTREIWISFPGLLSIIYASLGKLHNLTECFFFSFIKNIYNKIHLKYNFEG